MQDTVRRVLVEASLPIEARHVLSLMLLDNVEQATIPKTVEVCGISADEVDFAFRVLKSRNLGDYTRGVFTLNRTLFPAPVQEEAPVKKSRKKKSENTED